MRSLAICIAVAFVAVLPKLAPSLILSVAATVAQ